MDVTYNDPSAVSGVSDLKFFVASADSSSSATITLNFEEGDPVTITGLAIVEGEDLNLGDYIPAGRNLTSFSIENTSQGNKNFQLSLIEIGQVPAAEDLILSFGVIAVDDDENNDQSDTASSSIRIGLDQDGTSGIVVDATLIDGVVVGMRYTTESGNGGLTNIHGEFNYGLDDVVRFSVGSVRIGSVNALEAMADGKLFLQEIAGVGLDNITDDYVEKLAIFLQTIDSDRDPYNGIVITPEMHALFADDDIDLALISKEELVQLLLDNGLTPVDEGEAMQHVMDMLEEHAGQTEFEVDDNDAVALFEPLSEGDLEWKLADETETESKTFVESEEARDTESLHFGDLLVDVEDSDLSQYISVSSDGTNTVISVDPRGLGIESSDSLQTSVIEGVDLTVDAEGNALDAESMNELLRMLAQNGIDSSGSML